MEMVDSNITKEKFEIVKNKLIKKGFLEKQIRFFNENDFCFAIADGDAMSICFVVVDNFNNVPINFIEISEQIKRESWLAVIKEDNDVIWKHI